MLCVFIAFQGQELVLQSIIAFTIICTLTQCNPVQNDFFSLIRKLNVTLLKLTCTLEHAPHISFNCFLFKSLFVALGFKINPVCPAFAFACFCIIHTTIGFHFPLVQAQGRGLAVYTSHLSYMFVLHYFFLIVNLEESKALFYSLFISISQSDILQFNYMIRYDVFIDNIVCETQTDPHYST